MRKVLSFIVIAMLYFMSGCEKNADVVDPGSSYKTSSSKPFVTMLLPENICANEEFSAYVGVDQNALGKLQIFISTNDGISWELAAETQPKDCKNQADFYLTLPSGAYSFRANYAPAGCGNLAASQSEILKRNVTECLECDALTLEPNLSGSNYIVNAGETKSFTVEYTVIACDQDYYDLKLQGGLVAKADYKSSYPEGANIRTLNQNSVISWSVGDIQKNHTMTFRITFEFKIPQVPYGTMVPITGGWTISGKTADGIPVSSGDNNEIFVQVQ
jgi:hypothetical protein